jgi:hypothetical protein
MFKKFKKIEKSNDIEAKNKYAVFFLCKKNYLIFYNGFLLEKNKIDSNIKTLCTTKIGQPMLLSCDKESYFVIDTTGFGYILDENLTIKKKEPNSFLIINEVLFIKYEYDFISMSPKYGLFDNNKRMFIWNNPEYNNFFYTENIC